MDAHSTVTRKMLMNVDEVPAESSNLTNCKYAHRIYLLLRYEAHINIENCASPTATKYLYKYVTKGHDRAMTKTDVPGNHSEIDDYVDFRSVGSNEAVWHILSFHISKKYPRVQALNIHLEDHQSLVFEQGREQEAVNNAKHTHTPRSLL